MIDLDLCLALKVLHGAGIDVARSRAVDSAEDAIAFAERREARDPRFMPIVLRIASPLGNDDRPAHLRSEDAIRSAFPALWSQAKAMGTYVVAQAFSESGTDVEVRGGLDEQDRKALSTGDGAGAVRRALPLDAASLTALAHGVRRYGHAERPHVERMLEHALERLAHLFEEPDLQEFRVRLRLHENGAVVFDAGMRALRALDVPKRLDARAHDRKGDGYHPSGRQ